MLTAYANQLLHDTDNDSCKVAKSLGSIGHIAWKRLVMDETRISFAMPWLNRWLR